ncbi:MAG: alanine--tRNA ligase [Candidatus Portnoybacteria bacterium CG10_big_fil_rev_8_21_14_0_10_44_7]|uniref:Alanine--tRNA ligase n=1 Tax=Candidatus Portnoybacteria bacterium CG10_big_fil_rev_8_21_14_0_10_44_7 TaxID=1974816 RepID=A0A2M8KJ94_9BACT|nr:MAG: alanine--tRNA ligase [Candidatus Portnoybacteria bacterium CG10_big_fil_rev_8_21_14_0_10_44_7]
MTAQEIRTKFLKFMAAKGHTIIPSASLLPQNDPTTLFISAGMHPLVPHFLGEKHSGGQRVANIQKCIRTNDIDQVGDNRHLTFFEMMGNWSFGDSEKPDGIGAGYFKQQAIEWSWEFLTGSQWLGLSPERIYVTVFAGKGEIPLDRESIKIWQAQFKKAGIAAKVAGKDQSWSDPDVRIFPLGRADNWWEGGGQIAPGGPDSEMFFDTRPQTGHEQKTFTQLVDEFRFLEVWNDVFMQYRKKINGGYTELKQKNVDTGLGVERALTILNGVETVFETELFEPILTQIAQLSKTTYDEFKKEYRIIADHLKAAVFILAEGLLPSNLDQGYVLRRLIRRAIRYAKLIGIQNSFTVSVAEVVINMYKDTYFELEQNKKLIFEGLVKEEEKFRKTIESGLKKFEKQKAKIKSQKYNSKSKIIDGEVVFDLYQTYGFPPEITRELAKENGLKIDEEGFKKSLKHHQELSRTAAAGKFAGGLADHSAETTKLHTAAHLLLESLRRVLGEHVEQRGSNITAERLRFDFTHPEKLTQEQLKEVGNLVNQQIQKQLPVEFAEMPVQKAKELGATGVFGDKYGETVKVYTIGQNGAVFSREICGGPHVKNTKSLGHFKITKEQSSSAGVRRIKAVLET